MADALGSDDSAVGSKRRMPEIAETLPPLLPEFSDSVFPVCSHDDSNVNHSSLASSSSEEVKELIPDLPSPTSSKKVKCALNEENQQSLISNAEQKIGFTHSAPGFTGWEEIPEDCGRKTGNPGEHLQETKDSARDLVSACQPKDLMLESVKGAIACDTNEEFDNRQVVAARKNNKVRKGSAIGEKKGLFLDKKEAKKAWEAKKKQLFARIDSLDFDSAAGILGNLKGTDKSGKLPLKVEVIDDTAVIATVPVPKNGRRFTKVAEKNGRKNEKNGKKNEKNGEKNEKQEAEGKKTKRPRRKGKDGAKKMPNGGKCLNGMIQTGEIENGSQKNWIGARKYSREEMEGLRFVNIVQQKNLWGGVYGGLGEVVRREYKDLAGWRNPNNFQMKCDSSLLIGRKEKASGILGVVAGKGRFNHVDIFVS